MLLKVLGLNPGHAPMFFLYEKIMRKITGRIQALAAQKLNEYYKALIRTIYNIIQITQMRELRHENLTAFVGVCVESGTSCIVSAYCSRGSLARVLADRDLHLDDMFVASLVADLLRALTYLHESTLISHGNLTSSNCLVDSRWVLQIADYGLHNLKSEYLRYLETWRF